MLPVDLTKARGKSPIPPEPIERTEVKHLIEEPYRPIIEEVHFINAGFFNLYLCCSLEDILYKS